MENKLKFKEWNCIAVGGKYGNQRPAITLMEDTPSGPGEPIAVATVNLVDIDLAKNCIHVKNYSENIGMTEALEEYGFCNFIESIYIGPYSSQVDLCYLTDKGRELWPKD